MKSLKSLNKYFWKYRFKIFFGFFFILLSNIFALFPANLIGKSFDLIANQINILKTTDVVNLESLYYSLSIYGGLLILFACIRGVFMFYMRQNIIVVSRHIEYDLKNEIFKQYQNLSSNFYKCSESGDLLNRITEDVNRVRMYLGPALMYTLNLSTLIILILSRMIMVSSELTLIILLPLPFLAFIVYHVSHSINVKSTIAQKTLSNLTNAAQSTFSGIRLIKSFVREKNVEKEFHSLSEDYMNHNINLSLVSSVFFPLVLLLVGVSVLLTVYFGGVFVLKGIVTVGEVAEFLIYVNMLTWPVTSIGWVTEVIQRAAASQTRINEFLDKKEYANFCDYSSEKYFSLPKKEIVFQNVSYKYINTNLFALKEVNFKLPLFQITGLVGHVGSGKTTVIKILSGILTPSVGTVRFDTIPFGDLNWNKFRTFISYVSQDVFLFSDTIKNNILFGAHDINQSDLLKLTKELCLFDEIQSFSDNIDTYIGEGGITLSGGQKQRIALARALIRKPRFLILDDALSSVDSLTELKIMNYIQRDFKDTTIILSSNRLSVLQFCSKVLVFKSGNLIQEGSHEELIKKDGAYQNLFFNQIARK